MWEKVVVTGAAGFIGGHLCHELVSRGVKEIVGIDSLRSGDWSRTPYSVVKIEKDIARISEDEWNERLRGVNVLFHLAAEKYNSSKTTPEKVLNVNVLATERLFRAAAKANVTRTVFTSSLYAYGSMGPESMQETDVTAPTTLYGSSKLMGEGILRSIDQEIGMSWNIARLFFIYGPHQHAEGGYKSVIMKNFQNIITGASPTIYGDGKQSLDYVHISDCVSALIELAKSTQDKEIVNVSTGVAVSVNDLTKLMLQISQSSLKSEYKSADWTHGSTRCGNPNQIQNKFNWNPKNDLNEGLDDVYRWLKEKQ
jgi:UDP-glucose 4-epimerase